MDTSDPDIAFDSQGQCNHCTQFYHRTSKLTYQGESSKAALEGIVARIKAAGKSREFDCVIGVSGGIDSCYAAHVARSLGLRPLAIHMDNGWNSDIAVKNIKNVTGKLGIDYNSYVLDWEEFRDLQLSFLKASVPEIETPTDVAIPAALHRVAAEHGIRYLISGGNYATEGILPRAWHYNAKDLRYLEAIQHRFGSRPLKTFPTFGFWEEAYCKLVRGIRFVYLLNYVPYEKGAAMKLLEEQLGWRYYGGKHFESKITSFVQSYVLPVKFGIDYRRATLSTQICAGAVTRAEALAELEKPPFDPVKIEQETQYVAKKLQITVAELREILARPPLSHRDYPNSERWLERGYWAYRVFSGLRRRGT